MFDALLTLTFLQIEGVPITNRTQQSEPTKPVQQGTASQAQYAVTAIIPDKDDKKDKEMDIEDVSVHICMYIHMCVISK